MFASLVVALLAIVAPLQDSTGVVRGRIEAEPTGVPLAHAAIRIVGLGRVAEADSAGDYLLTNVPAGRRQLRATHPGYAPFEVEVLVPAGGELVLDVALALRPLALPLVRARGSSSEPGGSADSLVLPAPALGMAGVRALDTGPGLAEIGFAEAVQGAPGNEPVDPSDVLYVRGSSADLKRVLLDGAPVYTPFHLGGLIPSFEPDVLGSARLHLGGAPARYDGGLSYVMDLRTRAGSNGPLRSSGAADLLSARLLAEGAAGDRIRYLLAGRTVHGLGTRALFGDPLPYTYGDGLLRVDAAVSHNGTVSVMGFRNEEGVRFGSSDTADEIASWANSAVSVRYRGPLAGAAAELTAARGEFTGTIPLGGSRALLASGGTRRTRLAADLLQDRGAVTLRYGASYEQFRQEHQLRPRAVPGGLWRDGAAEGAVLGGYVDAAWNVAPQLWLRGGLRADQFAPGGAVLGPRASATWIPNARTLITLAAGRYHQHIRGTELIVAPTDPTRADSTWLPTRLGVASASHLSLALDQEMGSDVRLGLEGFFKRFADLPATGESNANASGVDVWVRRDAGRLTGWIGYSLAWVWSVSPGEHATSRFAGRQLLSSALGGSLGEHSRFDLRLAYGAGLPYTAIQAETNSSDQARAFGSGGFLSGANTDTPLAPLSGPPDKPYLRVDLELSRTWAPTWNGTRYHLSPYLRVLNALDRRDALFFRYETGRDSEPRPLSALPLLPVFGLEWRF